MNYDDEKNMEKESPITGAPVGQNTEQTTDFVLKNEPTPVNELNTEPIPTFEPGNSNPSTYYSNSDVPPVTGQGPAFDQANYSDQGPAFDQANQAEYGPAFNQTNYAEQGPAFAQSAQPPVFESDPTSIPGQNAGFTSGSTGYKGYKEKRKKSENEEKEFRRSEVVILKKSTVSLIAVISVVVIIAAAIGGGLFVTGVNSFGILKEKQPIQANNYTISPTSDMGTTEAVAKKVLNSVVGITTSAKGNNMFGDDYLATGQGTGMIVHEDGYILTNSHVISDGEADKIEVLLADGTSADGKCLWFDADIDLAIVKINLTGLTPVEIGDSDIIQIGSYVAAIGNPLGLEFNGSVTQGIVSGLNRSIVASSGTKMSKMEGLIQVDAAINPGNSGGPLLNSTGQVIGVNTAKASAEGMGFAIPINTAAPIIDKVISTGSFQRPYMGVSSMNASDASSQYPELEITQEYGAYITAVATGSPAEKGGLRIEDIIIAVNDKKIETSTMLIKELLNYGIGDVVEITFIRDGKEEKTNVTLATQADAYKDESPSESQQPDYNPPRDDYEDLFPW